MGLQDSLHRLENIVGELEKVAANTENDVKSRQIDLFGGQRPAKPQVDNTLMAKTLDRTIERIENLLQVGSR